MARPQFKRDGDIDRQLEDLVKAASWKQAIALCEKRIKKGDKSDAAQVGAAHLCVLSHDFRGKGYSGWSFAETSLW